MFSYKWKFFFIGPWIRRVFHGPLDCRVSTPMQSLKKKKKQQIEINGFHEKYKIDNSVERNSNKENILRKKQNKQNVPRSKGLTI